MNRVSLVHLIFHLDNVLTGSHKNKSRLYQFTDQEKAKMSQGHIYRGHEVDPLFDHIKYKASRHEEKALRFARYDELFFEYRHKLVHNFREPGYGIEMSREGTNPYYHSYINGPWQLVFPVGFFRALVKDCLMGLEDYLFKNNINPYDRYEFGDMWIPKEKLRPKTKKK